MRVDNMGYKVKFLNYHPYFNSEFFYIKTWHGNHLIVDFLIENLARDLQA